MNRFAAGRRKNTKNKTPKLNVEKNQPSLEQPKVNNVRATHTANTTVVSTRVDSPISTAETQVDPRVTFLQERGSTGRWGTGVGSGPPETQEAAIVHLGWRILLVNLHEGQGFPAGESFCTFELAEQHRRCHLAPVVKPQPSRSSIPHTTTTTTTTTAAAPRDPACNPSDPSLSVSSSDSPLGMPSSAGIPSHPSQVHESGLEVQTSDPNVVHCTPYSQALSNFPGGDTSSGERIVIEATRCLDEVQTPKSSGQDEELETIEAVLESLVVTCVDDDDDDDDDDDEISSVEVQGFRDVTLENDIVDDRNLESVGKGENASPAFDVNDTSRQRSSSASRHRPSNPSRFQRMLEIAQEPSSTQSQVETELSTGTADVSYPILTLQPPTPTPVSPIDSSPHLAPPTPPPSLRPRDTSGDADTTGDGTEVCAVDWEEWFEFAVPDLPLESCQVHMNVWLVRSDQSNNSKSEVGGEGLVARERVPGVAITKLGEVVFPLAARQWEGRAGLATGTWFPLQASPLAPSTAFSPSSPAPRVRVSLTMFGGKSGALGPSPVLGYADPVSRSPEDEAEAEEAALLSRLQDVQRGGDDAALQAVLWELMQVTSGR